MKLGVYTAVLHDMPLREALDTIRSLGRPVPRKAATSGS